MIQPAAKVYDARKAEKEVQEWWLSAGIYEKVKRSRETSKPWYFLDGPPYASGSIHLGTAWNKIIKDTVIRYQTMCGRNVRRQPGWDCHGLPIEVKVEELLGIKSKKDIEQKIGVEEFVEQCKKWATDHVRLMTEQFKQLGVWMDWDDPYITFKRDYIESAWWTLKKAYERGLVKKDLRVIHWCPRCETALAEHEVRGEYQNVSDPSLYVRFRLRDRPNEYLLVWTTTPWTLPADLAVCVNPDYDYSEVEIGGDIYILATALVEKVMKDLGVSDYREVGSVKGVTLEGIQYEHPLLEEVPKQREFLEHHRVILGSHVTLDEGTGCVHTAPGHGEEDFEVGLRYGLPVFSPVGPDGRFTEEAGKYAGIFVKEADGVILEDLRKKGLLVKHGTVVHQYPHCWRCQSPLLFRATEQWFLKVAELKSTIIQKNAEKVKWVPDWATIRYANGVESVGDWCISRQRYWGIPLPIWVCEQCQNTIVVGSLEELSRLSLQPLGDIDLHRPHVDRVEIKCPKCGGVSRRVPDVLDVWFDSGIASWASLGYPKRQELFNQIWPSDFVTEGEDQVTKWFYSQQVVSIAAFGEVPYRRVLMHGFALDEKGRKMSKSLGNVVNPEDVVNKNGVDVLRLYILGANPPWEDLKFSWKSLEVVQRMMGVLWNVHVFATTYMSLDGFDPRKIDLDKVSVSLMPEDLWMISRINSVAREVTQAMEDLNLHSAVRVLSNFILEDLSRWYVRSVRERVWIEKEDPKKLAAYVVLYQALHVLVRLMAPFAPHITEVIYRDLVKAADPSSPESVHMLPWPSVEEHAINSRLEEGMRIVRALVEAGAAARQQHKLKLRWPVKRVSIRMASAEGLEAVKDLQELLRSQLNCKELLVVGPKERLKELGLRVKVDEGRFREKFGDLAERAMELIKGMDARRLAEELDLHGFVGLQFDGYKLSVHKELVDFEEEPPEGIALVQTEFGLLAMDTRMTPELEAESLARELVRRLQMMRKEMDLGMEERVDVVIGVASEKELESLSTQQEYISREVRVRNLRLCLLEAVSGEGYLKDWNIDGDNFRLLVKKVRP
ncbi:MAG: isoleucine--tRNA ligase [Candidatus Hadarchaeum yellowstonense]|uniref:Isoleucine--tRNA ligase n=1 Tax=Hadarchaeum yellowstonense TaxID=1776334 RepID=A0A147JTM4_HADYE|nr:MAG: isoleucine--tRNA ligase [Candidatus Hadarchaeum yellowstonense]